MKWGVPGAKSQVQNDTMTKLTNSIEEHIRDHIVMGPDDGDPFRFGGVGGRFKIGGEATHGRFAVAQLPEIPRIRWRLRCIDTTTRMSTRTCLRAR